MNSGSVTPVGHLIPSPESVLLTSITANDLAVFDAQLLEHCVLNFTSFVSLLRALILFGLSKRCIQGRQIIRVVNVSSLAAIRELNGLSIYGAIKAARESILRSLSLELNANYPDVDSKFLNYAPGPMQTELVRRDLLGVDSPDNAVKSGAMRFVEPRQSAMICIDLLINAAPTNSWENGAHVDYFDIALD
jgi:short-subunit dehydrogenase